MTTSIVVHPAGHHVRVTTLEQHVKDGPIQPTAYELEPGQAPRNFYVHSTMSLSVEEFDPNEISRTSVVSGLSDTPVEEATPGLPIPGYQSQTTAAINQVTTHKQLEEAILRVIDELGDQHVPADQHLDADKRWLAIARTNIEQGFMALNRSVFKPARVILPTDNMAQVAPAG